MDFMENKKYFDILQVYRGIAALLVVIHHTYTSFEHFTVLQQPYLDFIAKIGKLGVDFFFVLSGFIIAYTTYKYRGQRSYLGKYFSARLTRIYIPYLPVSIGLLILYSVFPGLSESGRSMSILTSLTLFPYGNPALSVAWTLVFEMFFYIVYAINFFSKKAWYWFLGIWISCIILTNIFNYKTDILFLNNFTNLYNLEFILGVFIAYFIKAAYQISLKLSFSLAIITFFLFVYTKFFGIELFAFSQNLIFSLSAGFFVILGVLYWNKPIKATNVFMLIGNSSYSLYLLHNPLQSILVRIVPKSHSQFIVFIELILVMLLICFISYIYYLVFEKKLIDWTKKKIDYYVS